VTRALHGLGEPQKLLGIDEALDKRDSFQAGDFQTLALLDDVGELRCFKQGFLSADNSQAYPEPRSINYRHISVGLISLRLTAVGS
jgi:hypothetical protein